MVGMVERGVYPYVAAQAVGIHRGTFYRYLARAAEAEVELEALGAMTTKDLKIKCRDMNIDPKGRKAELVGRLGSSLIRLVTFRDKIEEAASRARAIAEAQVRHDRPLEWLRYGPGRERVGAPGWTGAVKLTEVDEGPKEEREIEEGDEVEESTFAARVAAVLVDVGVIPNVSKIEPKAAEVGPVEQEPSASE